MALESLPRYDTTATTGNANLQATSPPAGHQITPAVLRRPTPPREGGGSPIHTRDIAIQSPSSPQSQSAHAVFLKNTGGDIVSLTPEEFFQLTGKHYTPRLIDGSRPNSPFTRRSASFSPLEAFVFSLQQTETAHGSLYLEKKESGFSVRAKQTLPAQTSLCEISGQIKKERLEQDGFEHISTSEFSGIGSFVERGFPNCTLACCFSGDMIQHFYLITADAIQKGEPLCCNWAYDFEADLSLPYSELRPEAIENYFKTLDLQKEINELAAFFSMIAPPQEKMSKLDEDLDDDMIELLPRPEFDPAKKAAYEALSPLEQGKMLFDHQSRLSKLHYIILEPLALFTVVTQQIIDHSFRHPRGQKEVSSILIFNLQQNPSFSFLFDNKLKRSCQFSLTISSFFNQMNFIRTQTELFFVKAILSHLLEISKNYPAKDMIQLFEFFCNASDMSKDTTSSDQKHAIALEKAIQDQDLDQVKTTIMTLLNIFKGRPFKQDSPLSFGTSLPASATS